MKRALTILALSAMTLGLLAIGAAAQEEGDYPPRTGHVPRVDTDVTVTTPGATIRIQGTNWGPGTTVHIVRDAGTPPASLQSLGTATASQDGSFTAEIVVPEDAEPGDFVIVARGADGSSASSDAGTATADVVEREIVLAITDTGSAESFAGATGTEDSAAGFLTVGNALLALLVAGALALLLFGPVRRRRVLPD